MRSLRLPAVLSAVVLLGAASINGIDVGAVLAQRAPASSAVGTVAAVVERGRIAYEANGPVDEHTLFEVGSITKSVTGTLLAQMVLTHEVALDDPIEKYLPAGTTGPVHGGKHITLRDLATQSSGLPTALPANLVVADPANPWATYTTAQLYEYVAHYALTRDPGSQYEYSNAGVALLGHLLENRAATPYAALVHDRILVPLGMNDTFFALTPALRARLATPHDVDFAAVPSWNFGAIVPAGGMLSTAEDIAKYVRLNLGEGPPALVAAAKFAQTLQPGRRGPPGMGIGLIWLVDDATGVTWHNGRTFGSAAFVGVNRERTQGVAVLTNVAASVDDIGFHLLVPSVPLTATVLSTPEAAVDDATLESYVGTYVLAPGKTLTVTRDGRRLYAQLAGQPRYRVFATAPREFAWHVVDARLSFTTGADGRVTGAVLHQGGRDVAAARE